MSIWYSVLQKEFPETRRALTVPDFDTIWYNYYHWIDTSAGGLLIPEGIIRPVVSVSALTCLIIYIYYWNAQYLNNVIIIKFKVHLPRP